MKYLKIYESFSDDLKKIEDEQKRLTKEKSELMHKVKTDILALFDKYKKKGYVKYKAYANTDRFWAEKLPLDIGNYILLYNAPYMFRVSLLKQVTFLLI